MSVRTQDGAKEPLPSVLDGPPGRRCDVRLTISMRSPGYKRAGEGAAFGAVTLTPLPVVKAI